MKNLFIFSFLIILSSSNLFPQSGWNSIYFYNVNTFSKVLHIDSLNYISVCNYSKYYYKSSNSGVNWECKPANKFDSVYNIIDGQFINSQTGWLVGENPQFNNGVIIKTTNAGINWIKQNTGYNNFECTCINFLDENTGWVGTSSGNTGYLLKTTNGGINWAKQEFPNSAGMVKVKFFNINNGWIMGRNGLIAQTNNGGQNWIYKSVNNLPPAYNLNGDLFCISFVEVWAIVQCISSGLNYSHFMKSTDSGNNWNLMYSYSDSLHTNSHGFWKLNFINSNTGFASGDINFIVRTTNSGVNWNRINTVTVPFTNPIITYILPLNQTEMLTCGGFSGVGSYEPVNYILKSTNTGLNWSFNTYNYYYKFRELHFRDEQNGLTVTDTGIILKTTNLGNSWTKTFVNNTYSITALSFANNNIGNAFGTNGKILLTTNYGNNWSNLVSPTQKNFTSAKFINSNTGFVVGNGGVILKSTNTGYNWNALFPSPLSDSFDCIDISFVNDNTGWVLAKRFWGNGYPTYYYYYNTRIIRTTNGGLNWNISYDTVSALNAYKYFNGIVFFDGFNAFAYTSNSIWKSTNGGSNWFLFRSNLGVVVNKLNMLNEHTGWIGGLTNNGGNLGTIHKTTDGGYNWFIQFSKYGEIVRSIYSKDSNNVWFGGDRSSIYHTTNGGGNAIGIISISSEVPPLFSLHQNYPNPFNPVTKIRFDIPSNVGNGRDRSVKVIIYDLLGREITTLVNEQLLPGSYSVDWDGSGFASGVYFYSLVTNEFVETKRMVLIK